MKSKINNVKSKIHSQETKDKISKKRKQYLRDNPDKHPWKRNNKFKSVPCENFKKILDDLKVNYIPEYTISEDRAFAIDIALPQYKIAIEINGNQHYNSDGTLKDYYQERHDFIKNLGYEIYELHYSLCFNKQKINNLIISIIDNKSLFDFNYKTYLSKKLNKHKTENFCKCGAKILSVSKLCNYCYAVSQRKVEIPELCILLKEVKELGYSAVGRKYGVSDTAIRKWIK